MSGSGVRIRGKSTWTCLLSSVTSRSSRMLFVGTAIWAVCVLGLFMAVVSYSQTAGKVVQPPKEVSPNSTRDESDDTWTMVMGVHPRCPCTNASVTQLQDIAMRSPAPLRFRFLVYLPKSKNKNWADSALLKRIRSIDKGTIEYDIDGREAEGLGMSTSGSVVLLDRDARSHFFGGITLARNHEGESQGSRAVLLTLAGEPSPIASAPVYGCRIQE